MAVLTPVAKMQFLDATGAPLVGGLLYTYAAGTTNPQATYTDSSGGTANTNPVVLDSRGEANVWLGSATYKFKLCDADNSELWTVDNISAPTASLSPVLSGNVTIDTDSAGPALKITQTGTGPVLKVQDSTDPDLTPFIIDSSGQVGIGTSSPTTALDVSDGSIQLSSGGATRTLLSADASNSTFAASGARGLILSTNGLTRVTISSAGVVTFSGAVVLSGGATFSGNVAVTGTLSSTSGLTVSSGGAAITGNSTVTGTLGVSSTLTAQNGLAVSTGGATVTAGGLTVTAGGLTVSSGGAAITGNSNVTGTLGVSSTLTASNGLTVASGGAAITGNSNVTGTLGVSSTLTASNGLTVASGGAAITGNSNVTGTLGVSSMLTASYGLTVSAGGAIVSAGGLTVTSGGATISAGGANITGNSNITGTLGVSSTLTATTSILTDTINERTGGAGVTVAGVPIVSSAISGDYLRIASKTTQSASGSSVSFTSIPTWARRITIMFSNITLSAGEDLLVQIGPSGGIVSSGYNSSSGGLVNGSSCAISTSTTGFVLYINNAARAVSGSMTIRLINPSTFLYCSDHSAGQNTVACVGGGTVTLTGLMTQLTVKATGTNTFATGSINVLYE